MGPARTSPWMLCTTAAANALAAENNARKPSARTAWPSAPQMSASFWAVVRAFLQKTGVRKAQAFFQRDPRPPAERAQLRGVEELLGSAVGLRAVVGDAGVALDDALDHFGQLADRLVLAVADVEERGLLRVEGGGDLLLGEVHQVDAGVGHVVAVHELAAWFAGAPQRHRFLAAYLGLVEFADQRRQDVARLEVVVVAGPVHVVRHGAEVARAVLAVERPAHLDAGDLRQGVRAVGRLERPGEEVLLPDRLRAVARVDAAGAEKQQVAHAGLPGFLEDVGLDPQVLEDEVGGVALVRDDAADLRRGEEHDFRALALEELAHRALIDEVELCVRAGDEVAVAPRLQPSHECRAGEAAMAGDIDARVRRHAAILAGRCRNQGQTTISGSTAS